MVFVGLSFFWDLESGIDYIDKYFYFVEEYIKVGVFFVIGIVYFGIWFDFDIVFVLFEEYVDS